ncbi:hypothetical protein QF026_008459 [Streptomyces aurantiacus]|nr:hypothetical protein [Streptomyces aurantiacus]
MPSMPLAGPPVCRELDLSESAYYARKKRPKSARQLRDEQLMPLIEELHEDPGGTYGARRITRALQRKGVDVARCTVERLMAELDIEGVIRGRRRRTTIPEPSAPRPPDLVDRDFTAFGPGPALGRGHDLRQNLVGLGVCGVRPGRVLTNDRRLGRRSTLISEVCDVATADWSLKTSDVPQGRRRQWRADRALWPAMRSPGRPDPSRVVQRRFWRLIATGVTTVEASLAVGVSWPVGARWFRHAGDMPPISLAEPTGRYLAFAEREEITILRAMNKGVREIARALGRDPATISRELRRNAATRSGKQEYRATVAQRKAQQAAKRPKTTKLTGNDRLREYVHDRLAGSVRRPDNTIVPGPRTPARKGLNKPHRQDRR